MLGIDKPIVLILSTATALPPIFAESVKSPADEVFPPIKPYFTPTSLVLLSLISIIFAFTYTCCLSISNLDISSFSGKISSFGPINIIEFDSVSIDENGL